VSFLELNLEERNLSKSRYVLISGYSLLLLFSSLIYYTCLVSILSRSVLEVDTIPSDSTRILVIVSFWGQF
jgi:hypothetical protein